MQRDPAFFWRPNNIASRGRGGGKNRSATKFRKNDPQEGNFLNSFVQDCSFKKQHSLFLTTVRKKVHGVVRVTNFKKPPRSALMHSCPNITTVFQPSTPGCSGGGAGKGKRACNYVSAIWIPPPTQSLHSLESWIRCKCTSCTWLSFRIGRVCYQVWCNPIVSMIT